jgi:hypothetical protein
LAQFTGTIDISSRKAASEAAFTFTRDLIRVGASIPRKVDQIANVGDSLDRFSETVVGAAVVEQADRKLEADLARIREFGYINISVDASRVHSLTVAHCLLSNPFHLQRPISEDLHKSSGYTGEDYPSLSRKLVENVAMPEVVICLIVIDALAVQASGLNLFLL